MAQKGIIACLVGADFEDSELQIPRDRLTEAGYRVEMIGAEMGSIAGKNGRETVEIDKTIDQVDVDDYQALLIPGGGSPDHLRADSRFVEFVKRFEDTHKLIAAVCHGPQLLAAAELVEGRTLTAWQTIQHDLELMGATVEDRPVVVDDNWVTSRKPEDLQAFSDQILEELDEWEIRSDDLRSPAEHPSI
jgi:protease I